ncbi:hypothetical protein BKA64DRAFT_699061 [Cadophora sp. MPI-SDFR-AT-0126]|nr:hypothetical protein BKA64DRAFT_699061 [Leotiomycetes sp. MPI-SDFR-AT-0126]
MSAQEPPVPPAVAGDVLSSRDRSVDLHRMQSHDRQSLASTAAGKKTQGFRAGVGLGNVARRTLGIFLLLVTVGLWTSSNFLTSYIFADNTYSKPYFVTYFNTSFFAISLIPIFWRISHQHGFSHIRTSIAEFWQQGKTSYTAIGSKFGGDEDDAEDPMSASHSRLLVDNDVGPALSLSGDPRPQDEMLSVSETAWLSLEFCFLWFAANYLVAACLEYTSVASSTILTSTSSIWTLIFGALVRVEHFSYKKLIGGTGFVVWYRLDLGEIALGDAMAFGSAVMYGIYAVVMKKRIGNEDRVSMPLFFGLVGLFNVIFLWPGFIILHFTKVETFALPPTSKVWMVILMNSASSFIADYCWAYAMLLTTPLLVTVGLSMTIPLSLIGQMVISKQYSSVLYWVGAVIVLLSFLFINHESKDEDDPLARREGIDNVA